MEEASKNTFSKEIYKQFDWFCSTFLNRLDYSFEKFFKHNFLFKLVAVTENINPLFQGDNYFVSKVVVDRQHEVFIRTSETATELILDKVLGESNKKFDLNNITDIEAQIITVFNNFFYDNSQEFFIPPPNLQKRRNFNTIHLTIFVVDEKSKKSGKMIISLPKVILEPKKVEFEEIKFNEIAFKNNYSEVDVKIGSTQFLLKDLKTLEVEDIILLENSDINTMTVKCDAFEKPFVIKPNTDLIIPINIDEGDNMSSENTNLWDSIQVDMGAEFEKVKMTLGELKQIEEGQVVDISSIYQNKITLRVENKIIAEGELVIVNDRYGVKVAKIFADTPVEELPPPLPAPVEMVQQQQEQNQEMVQQTQFEEQAIEGQSEDDEFDYSDFDLEDEDL